MRALGFSWFEALMQAVLYVGFAGFVFVTSMVARQQAQARDEQRRLNAELRATRALLAESARVNERTRISREQIGRAHVCTPVTNAHLVCRLLPEKKKQHYSSPPYYLS